MEKENLCKYCNKPCIGKRSYCSDWCSESYRIYQKEQKCQTCGKIFHHNNTKKFCLECKPISIKKETNTNIPILVSQKKEKIVKQKPKIKYNKSNDELGKPINYSYHQGDESKNDRIDFKHWNDLLYEKEKGEKDTTYSSLWLFRKAKMIPPFTDTIGSSSPAEAKREGIEYFSEFNPLVSQNITNYWADENDIVLDPFGGRTRGIVSGLTHRKYFGFEISPEVHKAVMEVIESGKDKFDEGFKPIIYNDDSFNIDKYDISNVDCVFSCPPYWDLEQYESVPGQLSDIKDYDSFLERLKQIMKKCTTKLKENGFVCLVVGDFRKNEKLISFETDTIKMMESIPGIVLWDKIVLQNIDHGWASRKFGAIKHKRIVAKVTEYLLVFKKVNL
jgi:hypothetical protein